MVLIKPTVGPPWALAITGLQSYFLNKLEVEWPRNRKLMTRRSFCANKIEIRLIHRWDIAATVTVRCQFNQFDQIKFQMLLWTTSEHFYFDSRLNIATWPRKWILEQLFWTTFLNNFSLSKVVHKSCSNLNNFSKKLSKKVVQVGTTFSKSCPRKLFKFEQLV